MRISFKKKPKPEIESTRTITKFLWFPKIINQELRWLERSSYQQKYLRITTLRNPYDFQRTYEKWVNIRWLGQTKKLNKKYENT